MTDRTKINNDEHKTQTCTYIYATAKQYKTTTQYYTQAVIC